MRPFMSQNDDGTHTPIAPSMALTVMDAWETLPTESVDQKRLARHKVISADKTDPAHVAFDMLRTRLLQTLSDRGWSRVAVTSPTDDCGKTFVAMNLAQAVARRESMRTILMDLDLRQPGIADIMGITPRASMKDFLSGYTAPEEFFQRIERNLAVGLCDGPVASSAEILQESITGEVLDEVADVLRPDVMIYDLPPVLSGDEVVGFLPNLDGALIVAGGGRTTAEEIRQVERLFGASVPILGVILNKAEDGFRI